MRHPLTGDCSGFWWERGTNRSVADSVRLEFPMESVRSRSALSVSWVGAPNLSWRSSC